MSSCVCLDYVFLNLFVQRVRGVSSCDHALDYKACCHVSVCIIINMPTCLCLWLTSKNTPTDR